MKSLGMYLRLYFISFIMILTGMLSLGMLGAAVVFYGPYTGLRDLWVSTAMTTFEHQYLARMFFTEDAITKILGENKVTEPDEKQDVDLIDTWKDEKEAKIELVDVSNGSYKGYLLKISDPSLVRLVYTQRLGVKGMKVSKMCEDHFGLAAVNAGGFQDRGGVGSGGVPTGIIVSDGKIIYSDGRSAGSIYKMVGFNEDDVLVLAKFTRAQILENKIRDGVEFGPFLIVNGKPAIVTGNGGWGIGPRTAIGQTADGTVLLLVIDGRQIKSAGATLREVMDIMLEYGAVNAANLDGGSSSVMYYEGGIINDPCGPAGERYVPSAFLVDHPGELA